MPPISLSRQRQLELEAEAELELEQEGQQQKPSIFAKPQESQLGADQSNGFAPFDNLGKAIADLPEAGMQMGKDIYNFIQPFDALAIGDKPSGPYDVATNAGPEKTARTAGPLAAGTAGALSLGPWGSIGGLPGILAMGGIGFGAGMLGFDVAADTGTQLVNEVKGNAPKEFPANPLDIFTEGRGDIKPLSHYLNDFAYNAPQAAIFSAIGEGVGAIPKVKNLTKGFTKAGAETKAGLELDRLVRGNGPDAPPPGAGVRILDEAMQPKFAPGDIPDPFMPQKSIGEILDNPVLKTEQRALARTHPENYGRAYENNQLRNDAQLKYLDAIEPSQTTIGDAAGVIKQGFNEAQGGVDAALSKVPLPAEAADLGNAARQEIVAGRKAQGKAVTEGFNAAGDAPMAPEASASVVNAMQQSIAEHFRDVGAQPGEAIQKLIKQLAPEEKPVESGLYGANDKLLKTAPSFTVKDLAAARSKATKILKTAGTDQRDVAVAREAVRAIDKAFEEAIARGEMTPEQAASLDAGIAARREQGRIFEGKGSPTKSVLGKNYDGGFVVPDSTTLSKYWRPGNKGAKEAVRNYKEATRSTPEAMDQLHRYAATSFRRFAVDADGTVNLKRARDWLEQHADALSEAPEIKQQFGTVEKAQSFLNDTFGDLKRPQAEVESGALQLWLRDIEPKVAIRRMLSGDNAPKQVKTTTDYIKSKDKTALAGLRRGVIDHMKDAVYEANAKISTEEASMPGGPTFDGLTRDAMLGKIWTKQVRPAVEKSGLFNKTQLMEFDMLYKDKASQMSIEKAKAPTGSDSAQNFTTMAALQKIAGSAFLKAHPRTRLIVSVIEPMLRSIPQGRFLTALEEGILNPIKGRDLMAKATAANITKSVQQIFKEEWDHAFGQAGAMDVAQATAGAAMRPPVPDPNRKQPKPVIPKQQKVTAAESFPDPKKLLSPPAPGKPAKVDLSQYSPKTQAQISVESSGNPAAVSHKGARGLMQLMPDTAQDIAKSLGETYTPLDPGSPPMQQEASIKQNVRFGEHYRDVMLPKIDKAFKNKTLAMAAYNAGPGRVKEAIRLAGTSRDVNKVLSNLPKGVQKETVPYVQRVAERYGRG